MAVQQTLLPAGTFRLRHQQALAEGVAAIVRQGQAETEQTVQRLITASVPADEHAQFTSLVLAEFASLHAGNAVRFGIRPLEFAAWVGR